MERVNAIRMWLVRNAIGAKSIIMVSIRDEVAQLANVESHRTARNVTIIRANADANQV